MYLDTPRVLFKVANMTFKWTNGDSLTISKWNTGEPDSDFPKQTCTVVGAGKNRVWHDVPCSRRATNDNVTSLPLCERALPSGKV